MELSCNWEISCIVLEYIKILIWPLLVFSCICYFKTDISNFINRVCQFKISGVEIIAEQQKETQLESKSQIDTKTAAESIPSKLISDLVKNFRTEYNNITNEKNKLLNDIAVRDIIIDYERIYNIIFGSQINLLEYLKNQQSGLPRREMELFFENVKKYNYIFVDWNLNNYINFLVQQKLIEPFGVSYQITPKGSSFLTYISNMGYSKNKAL